MRKVEYATLIIGAQLNSADTSMYNYSKGDISKKEVTVKFSGYPIIGTKIDAAAQDMLTFLLSEQAGARRIWVNSDDYNYTGIDLIGKTLTNYGADSSYATVNATNPNADYTADSFYNDTNDNT